MGNPSSALITSQKQRAVTPPGPPFPIGSAVNGCSVDPVSGAIVWGNDVGLFTALLLSDRQLPMGAFKVTWLNGTNRQFEVNPALSRYFIGDRDNAAGGIYFAIDSPAKTVKVFDQGNAIADLLMDFTNQLYFFGSSGLGFPSGLSIDNTAGQEIDLFLSANSFLRLNAGALQTYQIGDLDGFNNSSIFTLDDLNKITRIDIDGSNYLTIDAANRNTKLGASNGNFTQLVLDNTNSFSEIRIGNNVYLSLDRANGIYQIGDTSLAGNGQSLWINDTFSVSVLGDVFTSGNGTDIEVDDASSIVRLNALNGLFISTTAGPALAMLGDPTMLHTYSALSDNTGVSLGTLTNAPSGGDPTKWIAIDDNGTMRFIPTWV